MCMYTMHKWYSGCTNDNRKTYVASCRKIARPLFFYFASFALSQYFHDLCSIMCVCVCIFSFWALLLIKRIFSVLCKIYSRDKHLRKLCMCACSLFSLPSFSSKRTRFLWLFIVHFSLGKMPNEQKEKKKNGRIRNVSIRPSWAKKKLNCCCTLQLCENVFSAKHLNVKHYV